MSSGGSQFYTGLVAEAYSLLAAAPPNPAPYERFVRRGGGTALELACGDGNPMLDLIEAGLDVQGLDSSGDMLERCHAAAAARGLGDVVVHHGDMADFDLSCSFASIYIAGASITLLPDDAAVAGSLWCMVEHLHDGARALVPFWIPPADADVGHVLEADSVDEPGTVLRCTTIDVERNEAQRLHSSLLRYERVTNGEAVEAVERWWNVHWLSVDIAVELATDAGFGDVRARAFGGAPADSDATLFTLLCRR